MDSANLTAPQPVVARGVRRSAAALAAAWLAAAALLHGVLVWAWLAPRPIPWITVAPAPPAAGLAPARAPGAALHPTSGDEAEPVQPAAAGTPVPLPALAALPMLAAVAPAATAAPTATPPAVWRTELDPIGAEGPRPPPALPTPAVLAGPAPAPVPVGVPNPFATRRGAAKAAALAANGGTQASEDAVDAALKWLARTQGADGLWSRQFFDVATPREPSGGEPTTRLEADGNLSVTGLAVLAFTAAGHSPAAPGPYQATLQRSRAALLAAQARKLPPDGGFNATGDILQMYDDAVATFALAELCLAAQFDQQPDPAAQAALQRAVDYLASAQQRGGGWDYHPARSDRNDTSITGLVAQALKAAKAAGATIPPQTLFGLVAHVERASQPDGTVWYADRGIGVGTAPPGGRPALRYGPGMLGVGMTLRLLLGYRPDDVDLYRQTDLLFARYRPTVEKLMSGWDEQFHDYYYWYYGTLACLNLGGDAWRSWHPAVRDGLISIQRRSGNARGSWNPYGAGWGIWGRMGGRVYSTAINALTLESFYRNPPSQTGDRGYLLDADLLNAAMAASSAERRFALVRLANRLRDEIARPVLLPCLSDPDENVQLEAALALAVRGERAAEPILRRLALTRPPEQQARIAAALSRLAAFAR